MRRIKKEQLEENELYYVAWGTCFYDNISTLRDGMRCTESKLTFVHCKNNSQALSQALLSAVLTCVESMKPRTPFINLNNKQLFASRQNY